MTVVLAYCLSPFWAVDKGMAIFGIVRYLPVFFYMLLLMQCTDEERNAFFALIPITGAAMVAISGLLFLVPTMQSYVSVNGRLSGFFQYPNTFSAFLLAGLVILGSKKTMRTVEYLLCIVLFTGIWLAGSRTVFILLIIALFGILLLRCPPNTRKYFAVIGGFTALLAGGFIWNMLVQKESLTILGRDIGSLFVRFLYYKDAIPVIWANPFGLGYMGYRAMEGSFQTSRYSVSFVHSGLLQLFLDIGWIPALLLITAFTKAILSKQVPTERKLLLIITLAHCLLDFDMQFFVFWTILLSCLDFHSGKSWQFPLRTSFWGIPAAILCLWLGFGDFFYQNNKVPLVLSLTPFHTEALSIAMTQTRDMNKLDALADRTLSLNPCSALAHSAKANVSLSQGNILVMIHHKENALHYARYSTAEYCDYFEKLYTLMQWYSDAGDMQSALFCYQKLCTIPESMAAVSRQTDPLASQTGNNSALELPSAYTEILDQLAQSNGSETGIHMP